MSELLEFGKFLNSRGYDIFLDKDNLWAEDWGFQDHKTKEVFELCEEFFNQLYAERCKEVAKAAWDEAHYCCDEEANDWQFEVFYKETNEK